MVLQEFDTRADQVIGPYGQPVAYFQHGPYIEPVRAGHPAGPRVEFPMYYIQRICRGR